MKNKFKLICDQLIKDDDVVIDDVILKKLDNLDIVVEVCSALECGMKIYSKERLVLSHVIPILNNFSLKAISEVTFMMNIKEENIYVTKFIFYDFQMKLLYKHRKNIEKVLTKVLNNEIESGKLLTLVYAENFDEKEILLTRAIDAYAQQLIAGFSKNSLERCVLNYSKLFLFFIQYFFIRFDPKIDNKGDKLKKIQQKIFDEFKQVTTAHDDKVLKLFYQIIQSAVRTNYFYTNDETLVIKYDVTKLSHILKGVQPSIEIFVYSYDLIGTHLRVSKVCRGGIRWSNRYEDFRTEIRSLMITQEAKNAVIVPKGAKGGFIIKKDNLSKSEFQNYYVRFINSLLDMVDNKRGDKIVKNEKSVIYDGDDPYFVVAADRGTSGMSDVANSISSSRNFWLKDAFASGSSTGYHHKKLGITAKGALTSSQRFFIEEGIDFFKESISVVGVGSMSGDVFGNGMIIGKKFKLLAAISHNEIFIDPNPDIEVAYNERKRLFESQKGSWSNYDRTKISKGGGVYKRSDVNISLTPQIKNLLGTNLTKLDGEELAKQLLKLDVDLLYFGGIGTYVKSSSEDNVNLGDKENEFVRVDGKELNAKAVCEGANLALTMLGRIEYSLNGGKINLDSIDNSAGVNISDHEVNIKILLNSIVESGNISHEDRDMLIQKLTDDVVKKVLHTNYLQSLSISLDTIRSQKRLNLFKKSISVLERNLSVFQRRYFYIPKDKDFTEIIDDDGCLIRPVISTIMLYSKILLEEILTKSDLLHDKIFDKFLYQYFPSYLNKHYKHEIQAHPLKKDLIATVIANKIINQAGITFIHDLDDIGVDNFLYKIKNYLILDDEYEMDKKRAKIYQDIDIKKGIQGYNMLFELENKLLSDDV